MITTEEAARDFCAERCDQDAMERLRAFIPMLEHENDRQNLVSTASLGQVWLRHIADSLQLLDHVPRETSGTWMDLGTGAGFPGLVLAIARRDTPIVLIESRKRRIEWLEQVVDVFSLSNCVVCGMRLENVDKREAAVITARAFAPLGRLLELSARFSTRSTTWLLPKGRKGAIELAEQPAAIQEMFHVEQSTTDPSAGILIGKGRPGPL
ncbi:16S rRNA (guanine(527)-N(7))-methyltransferase RsmG [Aurantiacibacter poecillastricola]|uniref:16S rRNA (guanine(527)-N(7))-methyltransferase RsmG n=1 Tax=Aurantiacibacter poecillastricola TaxID=3064385 RepID=UPI00274001BB|nr:16S rRNA (guanine(527)-N(7))-methyltransferase RsmG [Aurantiacibacter sp. 219JJ12-13]MDP5260499.1 16S rRNA (guanine(527)-N(7))-methyltransferase RsmG [Aurantiacibacter sp. 219JJ12-13]